MQNPVSYVLQIVALCALIFLAISMVFTTVQGEYGILKRIDIDVQTKAASTELAALNAQITEMENKTRRLSDSYLDLDLLDEQARAILGLIRPDEVVLQ